MTEKSQHFDEGTIHAWLDGALAPDESARVEAHASTCANCASLVADARGLIAASSRILSSLDDVPAGVIPGSDRGTDQLAALRARRTAMSRRWWRDPKVVAAASLVFIAGTFSVVWRASTNPSDPAPATPVVVDAASPAANAPAASPSPAAVAESREADLKAAARDRSTDTAARPSQENAPPPSSVVVTGVATEATSNQKMEAVVAPDPRRASFAANEAKRSDAGAGAVRQAADSASTVARADRAMSTDSLARQQGAQAPQSPPIAQQQAQRLAVDPLRADTGRMAAARDERSRFTAPAAVGNAAGFRPSEAASPAGACYELRVVQAAGGRPSSVADTVRLLDELVPERSDPSWRRARRAGSPSTALSWTWRQVDSATVELRMRSPMDSSIVRFRTNGALPELAAMPGVRVASATRVECQ